MKAELIGFNMMYKILKLGEDKWTKFEFIHYYPGKFSLFLIFIGPSGVASYNGENVVSTLAPSFLIGSFSYLQVTRTSITSRTSSKLGQIGPRTAELAALERLENSLRLKMGKTMSSHFLRYFLSDSFDICR